MHKFFTTLFNVVFHPDVLDGVGYDKNPKLMSDQDLVLEASNILDTSEYDVLKFVADRVGCRFDYHAWMSTGELPPFMRHWLRDNLHHLRNRLT